MSFEETAENIGERPKVLIVDDIPENLMVLSETLELYGYDVCSVNSGEEALRKAGTFKPDIILLDILMPGMNGYEVCTALKSDPELSVIPVIFLSAKVEIEDIVKGFDVGGSDYVAKPFNIREVMARVSTQIKLRKSVERNTKYIEQLKAKNEELNRAERELTRLNADKDRYFSILAHDLRNPFQGFMGLTDVLNTEIDRLDPPDVREMAGALNKSARKLYALLENLLTWSRIQLGRFEYAPETIDVRSAVNPAMGLFLENASEKGIRLLNLAPDNMRVKADRICLDTVLRNLISNAVKFSRKGSTVAAEAEEKGSLIEISVTDTGIGMDEDMIDNLFKLDKSTVRNGTGNEIGTGLGLLLAKELIEKCGGKIGARSEPGRGSTFYVLLDKC